MISKTQTQRKEFDDQTEIENYGQNIYEFVDAPSYVTVFCGGSIKSLHFVV